MQRRKDTPEKLLSQEQSGRTWKFAEILARATAVFGSQLMAEQWLDRPATGLDRRRPLDLLATPAGISLVGGFPRPPRIRRLHVTPLPAALLPAAMGAGELVAWRLDQERHAATWLSGEGAFRLGGRWNSRGVRAGYCSIDPSTAILEVAVRNGVQGPRHGSPRLHRPI